MSKDFHIGDIVKIISVTENDRLHNVNVGNIVHEFNNIS